MTDELGYLIYRSRARIAAGSTEAARICVVSRRRNAEDGVTGYLHRQDGWFVQYLEGPAGTLDTLMARIAEDGRHADVECLDRGLLPARRYADWTMVFTDGDEQAPGATANRPCPPIASAGIDDLLDFFLGREERLAAE